MLRYAGNTDFSRAEVNEEQHITGDQPEWSPHFRGEEIRGPEHFFMNAEEFGPAHAPFFTISRRGQAMLPKNGRDARPRECNAQLFQFTGNAKIAPGGILVRQTQYQLTDFRR